MLVRKNNVLMSKRPHMTKKSALHAFESRMIVLCIVSWCMLYLSYRRLLPASSTITPWMVNARAPSAHRPSFNRSTVSLRRDGLGIAIRRPLRFPAEARCEIAQFRGRRILWPLQSALLQEKNAPLLLRTRGDNLHTKYGDPAIKWCKSCPTWRARDQILQSASSRILILPQTVYI